MITLPCNVCEFMQFWKFFVQCPQCKPQLSNMSAMHGFFQIQKQVHIHRTQTAPGGKLSAVCQIPTVDTTEDYYSCLGNICIVDATKTMNTFS